MLCRFVRRGLGAVALLGCLTSSLLAQQSRLLGAGRPAVQRAVAMQEETESEGDNVVPVGATMEDVGYTPQDLVSSYEPSFAASSFAPRAGLLQGMYVRGEYLLWSMKGMELPPLVTTGSRTGPNANVAGFVNENGSLGPNTQVLFGNEAIHDQARSGGRITFGLWLDPDQRVAIEGDYFAIRDFNTNFFATSDGTTLIARPYYDETLGGTPNTLDVVDPTLTTTSIGSVTDIANTRFQGAGARMLYALCNSSRTVNSFWDGCPVEQCTSVRVLGGYRFLRLDDRLDSLMVHPECDCGRSYDGIDSFRTENQFHGADLGTTINMRRGRWTLDLLSKVAIGNTNSTTRISGSSTYDDVPNTTPGSVLALTSNIGTYKENHFTMVPEIGATLGYQIIPGLRGTVGYSVIYWSSVYRAGDQIDLHVNPDLWPTPIATTAGQWPQYPGRQSDFWAQGLSLGLEGQW